MKPYGIPRVKDLEYPDVVDIQKYALKSSTGRMAGDKKSYTRDAEDRHSTRRIFKKRERATVQHEIDVAINETML